MGGPMAIGVDVGGTKIAAGVVDGEGMLRERLRVDTPKGDSATVVAAIASVAVELAGRHPEAAAVGIGVAGYVSRDRDTMLGAPNLPLRNVKLASEVAAKTDLPTYLENDANAAA